MADNKKFYYLRLKDSFFDSDEIKVLESMQDGYLYSNILLKLYLRSLKDEGRLTLNGNIPYTPQMLASITGHQIGTVERALRILTQLGLVEVLSNGVIYMANVQTLIGKTSTEGERQRAYRAKISSEKCGMLPPSNAVCDSERDKCHRKRDKCSEKCDIRTPEIEIEKEIELETDTEIKKDIICDGKRHRKKAFVKPTVSEIKEFCESINSNVNAETFFDYYESNGWRVGRNPMRDWKASVRYWERNGFQSKKEEPKQRVYKESEYSL